MLCQRCLRTICPECQTQGAVGVVCPECLREQQQAQSPAQRKAERRWSRPRAVTVNDGRPIVTYTIIGLASGAIYALIASGLTLSYTATGIFMGMLPFVLPWPMMGLGIFGAFLQTFVFIMLTMVYIGGAVAAEEH